MEGNIPAARTQQGLQRFLNRLLARNVLSGEERQAILALQGEVRSVEANRDFVAQGQSTTKACLVIDGLVGRFAETAAGARQIVAFHIPGDMADLHSVVAPKAVSALQALGPVSILRIPHRTLRAVAEKFPALANAFWRDGIVDAGIVAQAVLNLGRRDAIARLAHLFCEMSVRYRQIDSGAGLRYRFPATQAHLADALGLTPIHVNRMLRALREHGWLEVSEREVRILDWDGLSGCAGFDPTYLQMEPVDLHP